MVVIQTWLLHNMIIVQFVYGLSFFSLGLVVAVQYRVGSRFVLADRLWALAGFAFVHAFADWGLVFIPLQARPDQSPTIAALWGLRTVLGAVSFGFLMHFGLGLIVSRRATTAATVIRRVAPVITLVWLIAFFGYPLVYQDAGVNTWYWVSEAWSRYMLGLPSGLIVALGLLRQVEDLRDDQLHAYVRYLYFSAGFFMLYGLTAGLIVPRQAFWPASVLNTEAFLQVVGFPIEILRTLTAVGTVGATSRLMGVFNVETTRRLYQAEKERVIVRERERIARDLHDGILQTLYGVGLGLNTLGRRLPSEYVDAIPIVTDLTAELSGAIWDLRHAITDLHHEQVPLLTLASAAHDYVNQSARLAGLPVTFTSQGFEGPQAAALVPTSLRKELLAVMREGLSNAVRHSRANQASVMLAFQEDSLLLRIADDGVGFTVDQALDPETDADLSHNGLRNMRLRAEQLRGVFRVESAPGEGTRLFLQIPVPELKRLN